MSDKKSLLDTPREPLSGPQTVKLSRPVRAHGEDVSVLTLREPTSEDIMNIGYPVSLKVEDKTGGIIVQNKTEMAAMISTLAEVPPSTIKSLHFRDYLKCTGVVTDFFMDSLGDQYSTAAST